MRNVAATIAVPALEMRVSGAFQTAISDRMKPLGKSLERLTNNRKTSLGEKERFQVEDMLNLGHLSVAAVYALWQIRHNVVGVPVVDKDTTYSAKG